MDQTEQSTPFDPFLSSEWKGVSSQAVADYFLDLSRNEIPNAIPLTHLKLQKLVYFSHEAALIFTKIPLIKDDVEAWQYGPVIPSLYQSLKEWKDTPISGNIASVDNVEISKTATTIIKAIWSKLKNIPAGQLIDMSHQPGTPWFIIWNNGLGRFQPITNDLIKSCYVR